MSKERLINDDNATRTTEEAEKLPDEHGDIGPLVHDLRISSQSQNNLLNTIRDLVFF